MRYFNAFVLAALFIAAPAFADKAQYVVHQGDMYGYEPAVTEQDRKAGVLAKPLVMFGYNGERNGVHQIMALEKPNIVITQECTRPCSYVKMMVFRNTKHVKTENIRFVPGSVTGTALTDAWNGYMDRFADRRGKKPLHIWCDEKSGCTAVEVKGATK